MTDHGSGSGSGNGSGNQAAAQQQPRQRKTHSSAATIVALRALRKPVKRQKNLEIEDRNAERALKRARHLENWLNDEASDDESIITVSDDEQLPSPASALHAALGKLSPTSSKTLIRAVLTKRPREDEDSAAAERPKDKKRFTLFRPEGAAGANITSFSCLLRDLAKHHVHMPLSLFTFDALEYLNQTTSSVPTTKLNAEEPGEKQPRVLDTALFEANFRAEASLDCGQWAEAAGNLVDFIKSTSGKMHLARLHSVVSVAVKARETSTLISSLSSAMPNLGSSLVAA
ncbi:hypothetical protein C8R46DRAFT_1051396 [Mycena filopes]|nr:hypothetical protein C8R46DRAFT_1051396 [Mycena filopes]